MELIQRCKSGDPNAFSLFFEQYKNLVFRTSILMLGDREEAEDALQEIFMRVHHSLHSYRHEKGAITTWLYRVTVNYCLNVKRKHFFDLIPLDALFRVGSTWKDSSVEMQTKEDIHYILQKLPLKLRAIIVLHYYWGLTYAEISQTLDIPIGTVQSRLNQALKKIRQHMEITCGDDLAVSGKEVKSS